MSVHSRQARIRDNLQRRADILAAIRRFFQKRDYLEVETPVRVPTPAPEAHIDPESTGDWFLQTSPELCMKRMLAAGYPRIFQICRCFRQGERGSRHLPEMTLLEWYTAGADYRDMMTQTETLIRHVAHSIDKSKTLVYRSHAINIAGTWERVTVADAFKRFSGIDMSDALAAGDFDQWIGLRIEPQLGLNRPVFLYDFPPECAALARLKSPEQRSAERFELYVGGLELCNGFSELTDAAEQRRRFEAECDRRRRTGKTTLPMPEPFLTALDRMPNAAGNALGIDRLVMLLADVENIDDVVAFVPEEL